MDNMHYACIPENFKNAWEVTTAKYKVMHLFQKQYTNKYVIYMCFVKLFYKAMFTLIYILIAYVLVYILIYTLNI